ncbi:Predicted amidohydrolase [Carboxydocella sp. JDF658]|nr:nitrilase-related carbon-nitrogen hydrolase [Carboxydocella sp. JDF658]GAW31298.1 Predicted amidohydrolase [Carboxydocella sp. JDF658]
MKREYHTPDVIVYWDSDLCTHSGNCVRALPRVFRPMERPWVKTDRAEAEEIIKAIDLCPSGALRYAIPPGSRLKPDECRGPGLKRDKLKLALLQMPVTTDKAANLETAARMLAEAAVQGAELAILPEMFNCPYQNDQFPLFAELEGEQTWQFLQEQAKKHGLILVGGSIPEKDEEGHLYNTCYVFGAEGRPLAKHRKVHLFDVDIPGGQYFKESDTLRPGDKLTVFNTPYCRMGVMICYDLRFPEMARIMALQGARLVIVPGAFNLTTGPAHWELLLRSRAVDNQIFTVGVAPARDERASYVSYGHSMVVDPWGQVVGQLGAEPGLLTVELDLTRVDQVRQAMPLWQHRRPDLYTLKLT